MKALHWLLLEQTMSNNLFQHIFVQYNYYCCTSAHSFINADLQPAVLLVQNILFQILTLCRLNTYTTLSYVVDPLSNPLAPADQLFGLLFPWRGHLLICDAVAIVKFPDLTHTRRTRASLSGQRRRGVQIPRERRHLGAPLVPKPGLLHA